MINEWVGEYLRVLTGRGRRGVGTFLGVPAVCMVLVEGFLEVLRQQLLTPCAELGTPFTEDVMWVAYTMRPI